MTSLRILETSVTSNSPSEEYKTLDGQNFSWVGKKFSKLPKQVAEVNGFYESCIFFGVNGLRYYFLENGILSRFFSNLIQLMFMHRTLKKCSVWLQMQFHVIIYIFILQLLLSNTRIFLLKINNYVFC